MYASRLWCRWHRSSAYRVAALVLLTGFFIHALHEPVRAQGFGVFEQSTCATGRAEAGVAHTCRDGSALFYNPAGILGSPGFTLGAGATVIVALGEFDPFDEAEESTDLDNDPIPAPHLYLTYGVNERLAAGLGVYVPYGLATVWPEDFEGAFLGYDNSLQSIYIQPTLAYQLTERIAVGGGPTFVIGSVELNQRVDLLEQPVPADLTTGLGLPAGATFGEALGALGIPTPGRVAFADSKLDADGAFGVGVNLGVQAQVTDRLHLGVRFLSPIELSYDGGATFEQVPTNLALPGVGSLDPLLAGQFGAGGALVEQDIETEVTMPAQFVAGVALQASEQLLLLIDYQWTGWSSFDEIVLEFENSALNTTRRENYDDTNAIRLGAEYALGEAWTVRGGYLFNQAAAPDETVTPLLPEANRNHVTVGLGWSGRFGDTGLGVDFAYHYLGQQERDGRVRDPAEGEPYTTALNTGVYDFDAHLFGTTLTARF